MRKNYSDLLLELKPLLPYRYQAKIKKVAKGVKKWHLQRAFKGESVPPHILRCIYNKAKALAEENVSCISNTKKEISEINSLKEEVL